MATEEQTSVGSVIYGINADVSAGQRLTISNRVVSKLSLCLSQSGSSPSGDIYLTILRTSDFGIIASKLLMATSSLSVNPTWYEVTFDSPVTINEEVALLARCTGADAVSRAYVYGEKSDVKAGEFATRKVSGPAWDDQETYDAGYIYTYEDVATPTVTTQAVTSISGTTATGNGNVTTLGAPSATQHGHCWNTTGTPNVDDDKTENGVPAATGAFTSSITGLTPGTKYYVRAYITNAAGTSYGGEVEFTADKGSVYPADTVARATQLIHRYNRRQGLYQLEILIGEVDVDIGIPYAEVGTRSANIQKRKEDEVEEMVEQAKKEAKKDVKDEAEKKPPRVTMGPISEQEYEAAKARAIGEPSMLTRYAREVIRRHPYRAAAITQQVQKVPSRPTIYAYDVLARREQEAQELERRRAEIQRAKARAAGEPWAMPVTERTRAIIISSPEAQRRLKEIQERRKSWWQKLFD